MTDIRDLIIDFENDDEDKTVNNTSSLSDLNTHVKIAEQLEAISEDDTLIDDLLKVAIVKELSEQIRNNYKEVDNVSNK